MKQSPKKSELGQRIRTRKPLSRGHKKKKSKALSLRLTTLVLALVALQCVLVWALTFSSKGSNEQGPNLLSDSKVKIPNIGGTKGTTNADNRTIGVNSVSRINEMRPKGKVVDTRRTGKRKVSNKMNQLYTTAGEEWLDQQPPQPSKLNAEDRRLIPYNKTKKISLSLIKRTSSNKRGWIQQIDRNNDLIHSQWAKVLKNTTGNKPKKKSKSKKNSLGVLKPLTPGALLQATRNISFGELLVWQKFSGDVHYPKSNFVWQDFTQRLLGGRIGRKHVVVVARGGQSSKSNGTRWTDYVQQRALELGHAVSTSHVAAKNQPEIHLLLLQGGSVSNVLIEMARYIVVEVTAFTLDHYKAITPNTEYNFRGLGLVKVLIQKGFKVQLLSASDYWSGNSNPLANSPHSEVYGPNALINEHNLDLFFRWGARGGALSRGLFEASFPNSTTQISKFKAYLFCTRRLDLAIPSRREYFNHGKFLNEPWYFDGPSTPDDDNHKSATPKRGSQLHQAEKDRMVQAIPIKKCTQHGRVAVEFRKQNETKENATDALHVLKIWCDSHHIETLWNSSALVDNVKTWMSSDDPTQSEAACVRVLCDKLVPEHKPLPLSISNTEEQPWQVACVTRILRQNDKLGQESSRSTRQTRPNLLVIHIRSLSRTQFDFLMPRTREFLEQNGFIRFYNYSTVSHNSRENRFALFHGDSAGGSKPLWETLRREGYATFRSTDICPFDISPNPTNHSTTHHGQMMQSMFCFSFSRPNCIGNTLAASHLLEHAGHFIRNYTEVKPWAAFVNLVDADEDTMTLSGILDQPLKAFLDLVAEAGENTTHSSIVITSDNGLDYGPYFQSAPGQKERYEPIMFFQVPSKFRTVVQANAMGNFVTPYDLHRTLSEMASLREENTVEDHEGLSLLRKLPKERSSCTETRSIPREYCTLLNETDVDEPAIHHGMRSPPSILSFFADIPKDRRYKQRMCMSAKTSAPILQTIDKRPNQTCMCTTSHRRWYDCKKHPWSKDFNKTHPHEYFSMVHCPFANNAPHIDIRVVRNTKVVSGERESGVHNEKGSPPNVLFLEIDSVSVQYANRHLPRTQHLLEKYRIPRQEGSDLSCTGGICAVDFPRFTNSGPNSVSNQAAALSGCLTTQLHPSCFSRNATVGDVCMDPELTEYGLRLQSLGPTRHTVFCPTDALDPFLYDIAKKEGYFTFFGEEFCYNGSPWVLQGNVFPLDADVALHKIYCRLASKKSPDVDEDKLYTVPVDSSKIPCMNDQYNGAEKAQLSLELIKQSWETYSDIPKFAYLNAIAAHSYDPDWSRTTASAEALDAHLANFLTTFLQRSDANRTIVVLRSDHGFQGSDTATIDYSTQIEHQHPWTQVLVPDHYPVHQILKNSDKMVTSYDLYVTLKNLISSEARPGPSWAFDLMRENVPPARTCREAKVPIDFCLSRDLVPFPNFGTCNMFEPTQSVFCRDPFGGGHVDPLRRPPKPPSPSPDELSKVAKFFSRKSMERLKKKLEYIEHNVTGDLSG